jgi:glycosyltransferase involved in cell wall biosynthesis
VTVNTLRVALDARRLQDRPLGGVGRSLAGVIDLLATEVDIVLLTDGRRPPVESTLAQHPLRPPTGAPETMWIQWHVPRWLRQFDGVFHGTFNQLPLRPPVPAVVTIHDLSFELHPEGFSPAKRRAFQLQARRAARVARRVLVPSSFTRDELAQCYGVEAQRILVTPWGVESRFGPSRAAAAVPLCAQLGVAGRYVIAMGGARRRGLDVAVAAWRNVRAAGTETALVVVGSERPPAEPGLTYAGAVTDVEWAALLAGAQAFCYPTRYEGFGVPALESIASGTPVVCAPIASLPEVLGDAAEWCEEPTVDAIAAGLHRVLDDPTRADHLRRRGLARAANHPTWEQTASVMLQAYRDADGR